MTNIISLHFNVVTQLLHDRNRILVVFSSAATEYTEESELQDYLNPYLKQIFGLMGFTRHFPVFIQGTSSRAKAVSYFLLLFSCCY
jgi:FMN-dependent NADH-azoreductase